MNGAFGSVTDKGIDLESFVGGVFVFFSNEHPTKLEQSKKKEGEIYGPKGREKSKFRVLV